MIKNVKEINNVPVEKKVLTPEEIARERKERNRKKYEKGQRKYQDTKKIKPIKKTEIHEEIKEEKKKIEIPDEVKSKKKKIVKEEELVKKSEVEIKPTYDRETGTVIAGRSANRIYCVLNPDKDKSSSIFTVFTAPTKLTYSSYLDKNNVVGTL